MKFFDLSYCPDCMTAPAGEYCKQHLNEIRTVKTCSPKLDELIEFLSRESKTRADAIFVDAFKEIRELITRVK